MMTKAVISELSCSSSSASHLIQESKPGRGCELRRRMVAQTTTSLDYTEWMADESMVRETRERSNNNNVDTQWCCAE